MGSAQAGGSLANSPGTPPSSDPRNGHPFFNNILEDEACAQPESVAVPYASKTLVMHEPINPSLRLGGNWPCWAGDLV